jgi:hypothetical protein
MDWSRYAGQLRPLTARDYTPIQAIEQETDEELLRAARKEYAVRAAARRLPACACEVCGDPTHHGGAGAPAEEDDE